MQRQRVSEPAIRPRRQPGALNQSTINDRSVERDALFIEFAPVVNRLIRKYAVVAVMPDGLSDQIYSRFCDLFDNYDPNEGVPLRPYLVRHLSSSVFTNAPSHLVARQRGTSFGEDDKHLDDAIDSASLSHADRFPTNITVSLSTALKKLPDHQQRVVVWRYYENRSIEDIGKLLGVDAATATSLLTHGLSNLKMLMHDR